jgi:GTP-binding protein
MGRRLVTPYCTIALFLPFQLVVFFALLTFPCTMSKLWQARFFTTVNQLRDLPATQVPEIAFAGRSNAGKSTAINILTNQKGLAFASKTPGRTQHINFFSIGGAHVAMHRKDPTVVDEIQALLVDLPGYGYAEVSGTAKLHWQKLLGDYVQQREQLAALVLIMDSRRPFTDLDVQMLEWFAPTGKPIHCILTKVDKLNRNESVNVLRQARQILDSYVDEDGNGFPFTVQLFSALKRVGIDEANDKIIELVGLQEDAAPGEAAEPSLPEVEDQADGANAGPATE